MKNLLEQIPETKHNREWVKGIKPFENGSVSDDFKWLYSDEEIKELSKSNIENRMIAGISKHYMELAKRSKPILNLIKARKEEMTDLSGQADPSNQLSYSPVEGLLHKYEMVLLYASRTCSAHCRYCYRLDLFTGKTGKSIATIEEIKNYIISHNEKVKSNDYIEKAEEQKFPIREALLSGGDPMVLSNKKLFEYMNGLAEANISTIRIGTKELAFFPQRFDSNFFKMLDIFHSLHPDVNVVFMVHFTHPDEFLDKYENGNYIESQCGYKWADVVSNAVKELNKRPFISMENQTPIIYKVNDDPDALRLMQRELRRRGVKNHYFFQCREIEGHRAFALPVEKAYKIHNESQKGLSGIERSRFALSTEWGKLEVVGLDELQREKIIIFKIHRSPFSASTQGELIIAKQNPEALWISGYEDRILLDGRTLSSK